MTLGSSGVAALSLDGNQLMNLQGVRVVCAQAGLPAFVPAILARRHVRCAL